MAGFDVLTGRRQVRRRISLTGQFAAVDDLQTGEENLRMLGRLAGLPGPVARRRGAELLERFDLTDAARRTVVTWSGGMTGGIIDRFRSMDVAGASVLAGHVAASMVRNLASTVLVFGVAFLIGFRPSAGPLDWLAAAGVLLLFILASSWLAAAVGLLARSPEAAGGFSFLVMFLPYPSSAFVPVDTMPSWIHGFARNQPVTPVIETLRGLLLGTPVGSSPWRALAWCLGIMVASVACSGVLFRRRTA